MYDFMRCNEFTPTKLAGEGLELLISVQGYNVLLTSCHCDQFLTPKVARQLANTLHEAADQVEDEKAFDEKCAAILAALTPTQLKLLEEKLNTVKEYDQ